MCSKATMTSQPATIAQTHVTRKELFQHKYYMKRVNFQNNLECITDLESKIWSKTARNNPELSQFQF